jgi:hypothetical protein
VCHALLHDPKFLALLLRIDHDLAAQTAPMAAHAGVLHRADYPRKPRGCLPVRSQFFAVELCCSCRRRSTSMSVRFLGRRVYLAVAVVVASAQRAGSGAPAARLALTLAVPVRTLERWRRWWSSSR